MTFATKVALRSLGRRVLALEAEKAALDELLGELVATVADDLLCLYAVGVDSAAALLVAAGDNPERIAARRPGPICAAWPPSRPPRARSPATASTGAVTARPTPRCGAS